MTIVYLRCKLDASNNFFMANVVIILGSSGTGKSTSLKTLNPDETVVINILGKRLPFKGSSSMYSPEKKNLFNVSTSDKMVAYIQSIDKNGPHVKNIIIDDCSYLMRKEFFARAKETGYGKYTDIGLHTQQVIEACEKARQDLNIFLIYHSEEIQDNGSLIGYKVATVGKLLDQTYNPVEVVPIVLFSDVKFMEDGTPQYGFYTKRTKIGGVTIPAKSPDGMFDDNFIPNDLGLVIEKMNQYFA